MCMRACVCVRVRVCACVHVETDKQCLHLPGEGSTEEAVAGIGIAEVINVSVL